jgi:elongation factor Tu
MAKETFLRDKPHLNVGTIGHIDHGKTTLSAAISARQAHRFGGDVMAYADIARGGAEREPSRIVSIHLAQLEYQTPARHYAHLDCPGHPGYVKNTIIGAMQMDAAILVVAADEGTMPQTREHLVLARQVGVTHLVVFLNKVDLVDDPGLLDLAEMEIRQLLNCCEFPGDDVPIIRGNALAALRARGEEDCACIDELMDALDRGVPTPPRDRDGPFLMSAVWPHNIRGRGSVVAGRIERGRVRVGDEVEIIDPREPPKRTVVTDIQIFRRPVDEGLVGDNVGLLLRNIARPDIDRGQLLAAPGSLTTHTRLEARIATLTHAEGGRHTPFFSGYRPHLYFRLTDVTGTVTLPERWEMCMPGDVVEKVEVSTLTPIVVAQGMPFAMREGGRTVGSGTVTKVLA